MLPTFPLSRCSFRFPNSLAKSCLHTLCSLSPYLCPAFKKLCSNKQGPVTGTSSARNVVRLEQSRICAGWLHSYMIYQTTKMECLTEQTFDKQLEHCCDQRSSILVGRVGIPSVTLTPAAPCSLTFVVGLLEWGSISDYDKLSNFILVSVQGHPRICLDRTTCCQMLALVADLEVIVKNKVLFWSPLPWPVLLENLLQARLFAWICTCWLQSYTFYQPQEWSGALHSASGNSWNITVIMSLEMHATSPNENLTILTGI